MWRARRDTHELIRADRGRITAVLATHPHPDPADRDPAARANAYAARLSDRLRAGEDVTREDFKLARADGAAHAYAAQKDMEAWMSRPEVALAVEHGRLNRLAYAAAKGGDLEVGAALRAGNPDEARKLVRAQELAEERSCGEGPPYAPHGMDAPEQGLW